AAAVVTDPGQPRSEAMHLERLRQIGALPQREADLPNTRGWPGQRLRRELEQAVRQQGVLFRLQAEQYGGNRPEAASLLGLPARTLRRWEWAYRHDHLQPRPLGRPAARSCLQRRNEVIRAIQEVGPGVGLPSLRGHFQGVARAELW